MNALLSDMFPAAGRFVGRAGRVRSFLPARKDRRNLAFAALENRRDCWPNRKFQKELLGARIPIHQLAAARGREEAEADARSLGREIAQVLRGKGTRLVLHFDLNKTLIMVDPAGRKSQSQVSQARLTFPPCNALMM